MTALRKKLAKADEITDNRALSKLAADMGRPEQVYSDRKNPNWRLDACRRALGDPSATPEQCGRHLKLSAPYNIRRYGGATYYERTVLCNDLDVAVICTYAANIRYLASQAAKGHLDALMTFPIEFIPDTPV